MSRTFRSTCCLFILFTGMTMLAHSSFAGGAGPFNVAWDKKSIEAQHGARFDAALVLHAPVDHYFYADTFDVEFLSLEGVRCSSVLACEAISRARGEK